MVRVLVQQARQSVTEESPGSEKDWNQSEGIDNSRWFLQLWHVFCEAQPNWRQEMENTGWMLRHPPVDWGWVPERNGFSGQNLKTETSSFRPGYQNRQQIGNTETMSICDNLEVITSFQTASCRPAKPNANTAWGKSGDHLCFQWGSGEAATDIFNSALFFYLTSKELSTSYDFFTKPQMEVQERGVISLPTICM